MNRITVASIGAIVVVGLSYAAFADKPEDLASGTVDAYLQSHPEMVIDLTGVSGEYCINTWKVGGGHMTHYATDPSKTQEDLVDFVPADSMTSAGVNVSDLPRMPGELGAMEPNKWYYLPAGTYEPHHGRKMPMSLLIRATNIE